MAKQTQGADLFIVDNAGEQWKVREDLNEWTDLGHQFDVATGYFKIGAPFEPRRRRQFLRHVGAVR